MSPNSSFLLSPNVRSKRQSCSGVVNDLYVSVGWLQVLFLKHNSSGIAKWKHKTVCFAECDSLCMLFSIQSKMFLESVLINWKGLETIYSPPCFRPTNMNMWKFVHHMSQSSLSSRKLFHLWASHIDLLKKKSIKYVHNLGNTNITFLINKLRTFSPAFLFCVIWVCKVRT